jgi:hypothetical protein
MPASNGAFEFLLEGVRAKPASGGERKDMKMRVAVAALLGAACLAAQAAPALARTTAVTRPATTPSASHPCGTLAKPGSYKHII